jgi:hypothetical protein
LKLPLGGLHVKHTEQRGIWIPTQHLLWDQGKPRKTLIELVVTMKTAVFCYIKTSSYFTGDTLRLRYRAQAVSTM